jgi:hypothetical protein
MAKKEGSFTEGDVVNAYIRLNEYHQLELSYHHIFAVLSAVIVPPKKEDEEPYFLPMKPAEAHVVNSLLFELANPNTGLDGMDMDYKPDPKIASEVKAITFTMVLERVKKLHKRKSKTGL